MEDEIKVKEYEKHYSEEKLFDKVFKYAKVAGINVIYVGLLLFYSLKNPDLPSKLRNIVYGALGYFILPIDLIPDITPVVGYVDDLGILMAALIMVALYIDEDVKNKAKAKLKDLFGEYDTGVLDEVDKKVEENRV